MATDGRPRRFCSRLRKDCSEMAFPYGELFRDRSQTSSYERAASTGRSGRERRCSRGCQAASRPRDHSRRRWDPWCRWGVRSMVAERPWRPGRRERRTGQRAAGDRSDGCKQQPDLPSGRQLAALQQRGLLIQRLITNAYRTLADPGVSRGCEVLLADAACAPICTPKRKRSSGSLESAAAWIARS